MTPARKSISTGCAPGVAQALSISAKARAESQGIFLGHKFSVELAGRARSRAVAIKSAAGIRYFAIIVRGDTNNGNVYCTKAWFLPETATQLTDPIWQTTM